MNGIKISNTMREAKRKEREEKCLMKAKETHNGKYTYSNFVYVNNTTKGYITCPIHGDFLQTPKNHMNGQGCPVCGKEYAQNWRKNNFETLRFLLTSLSENLSSDIDKQKEIFF